jgi:type II secretory pathway pseudopilin PulG
MKAEAGYTMVELLAATAVLLVAAAGFVRLLDSSAARATLWNESADLQQRARVAGETLISVLGAAGAGTSAGPLQHFFAAVDPRRRPGSVSSRAVTVRSIPADGARGRLAQPLAAGSDVVTLTSGGECPSGQTACGFETGMDIVLFDGTGQWDAATVRSTGPGSLVIADRAGSRSVTYPAGAQVAQFLETTLFVEDVDGTLRREHAGVSNLPIIDNVIELRLEYFGDPSPPVHPRPPAGTANCLYGSDGARIPYPTLPADDGSLATMPLGMLDDGPMCGAGATAYDMDLLRVRKIRATIRLQSGHASLRGSDPSLFARPGAARASDRQLPDLQFTVVAAPRNLNR